MIEGLELHCVFCASDIYIYKKGGPSSIKTWYIIWAIFCSGRHSYYLDIIPSFTEAYLILLISFECLKLLLLY